ncbi:MAG: deoxyribodipyrimidine photo-lyase [Alphaproteobacteria bacterium]|nr:MAG: deoxyribodipyrimidine photo-lyase [Alphaproteobacteria bacterium]
MNTHVTIWWMRQDLRLQDNPALAWAAERGKVVPVYIVDEASSRALGGASAWWLEQSLTELRKHVPVVVKVGPVETVLRELIEETDANAVVWNRCYEPWAVHRDTDLKALLKDEVGIDVESFNAGLLHEPWEVKTLSGTEFKVYTPFWKACLQKEVKPPCPVGKVTWVKDLKSDDVRFYPVKGEPDWAHGWDAEWTPGEDGAQEALKGFIKDGLADYAEGRDLPARDFTSKLGAHLHFGEIGPRQIWAEIKKHTGKNADKFLAEIGWREFCHHLLYHYPTMMDRNWKQDFDAYPWRDLNGDARKDFDAWTKGQTGYPIVDAGMRQLWQTGWMHNRVRMITASFLIKHLRIDWREGETWFWDTLVDADAANNACGWQWVAGSGADASPYFRIFNPMMQGAKFDPKGEYVTRWCPELKGLPAEYVHAPWEASSGTLAEAGIVLGKTYPKPIVDHAKARAAALAGYAKVKE